jgi:Flp pilus assembly protein TadD
MRRRDGKWVVLVSFLLAGCAGHGTEQSNPKALSLAQDVASQGDPAAAGALYERAISVTGATPAALTGLGQARLDSGNAAGAADAFRHALAVQPDNTAALYGLGSSYLKSGEPARAAQTLARAAPRVGTAQAYTRWGYASVLSGDTATGVGAFRHALSFKPDDPDAQCNLALALVLARQDDEAAAVARNIAQSPLARASHRRNVVIVLALAGRDSEISTLLADMDSTEVRALTESAHAIGPLDSPTARARSLGQLALGSR